MLECAMHPLISTQALAECLAQPDAAGRLRLIDTTVHLRPASPGPFSAHSGRPDFEAAHIPGATFVDLQDELSDTHAPLRFTLPAVPRLEAAFRVAGLSDGDHCVLYSSSSPMWATRVWWMLKALGFEALVLDGGLAKWRAEGRALASGPAPTPSGRFQARPQPGLWADRQEVLRAVGAPAVCTLNALTAASHDGSADAHYGRPGHIAGSVNLPFPALLNGDGTLKPEAELRSAFAAVGALSAERVICYCGGGIAATLEALALSLVGQRNVGVYDGSLAEWAQDPRLPMAIGA
jgi:thiosulfate/3-mercaptopyruvate sulfurtransferase